MICYKDMTFCSFVSCDDHVSCPIFLSQEMYQDAMKWWGDENPPICIMVDKPGCYKCATTQK
jgi:hypothetical protein